MALSNSNNIIMAWLASYQRRVTNSAVGIGKQRIMDIMVRNGASTSTLILVSVKNARKHRHGVMYQRKSSISVA